MWRVVSIPVIESWCSPLEVVLAQLEKRSERAKNITFFLHKFLKFSTYQRVDFFSFTLHIHIPIHFHLRFASNIHFVLVAKQKGPKMKYQCISLIQRKKRNRKRMQVHYTNTKESSINEKSKNSKSLKPSTYFWENFQFHQSHYLWMSSTNLRLGRKTRWSNWVRVIH